MTQLFDLTTATGKGTRVALIDSGVNAQHSHVRFVAGGVGLSLAADGTIQRQQDFSDRIGHGTALAGILRAKAPQVELYAVKVFNDRLQVSFAVLEAALRWGIEQRMHVINLSLGTANLAHRDRCLTIIAEANAAGTALVASSPAGQNNVLPAALPGVIGVADDDRCGWSDYLHVADDPIPFHAHAHPRPLPGPAQARNFRGPSFASAHVSALLALLIEQNPGLTGEERQEELIRFFQKPR
jgi:subtilisin family serine protease